MVVSRGDVFWASLPDPVGSGPGFPRPVVVVQSDDLNASRIATVVVVPFTSNLRWATAWGNVLLPCERTNLARASVANVSLIAAIDRGLLSERVGRLQGGDVAAILSGIDIVLGRA